MGGNTIFDLIVLLSRYVFIFYILYFIILFGKYLLNERNISSTDTYLIISKQRINIILMHLTGFLLISYDKTRVAFDYDKILVGFASCIFFIFAFLSLEKIYKKSCFILWNGIFLLIDISLIIISRLDIVAAKRQVLWIFFGFVATLILPFFLKKFLENFYKFEKIYLIFGIILLLLPSFFGVKIYGAMNWIRIGNFSMQPSEIVKILFIFYLASAFKGQASNKKLAIVTFFSIIMMAILATQRDLGGALIYLITFMSIVYIKTGSILFISFTTTSLAIASIVAYYNYPHVRLRLISFLDPWSDYYDLGYQILNSLFAIGTWGAFGAGLTRGMPEKIPAVINDFVFSAICEEFGTIFGLCVIIIYFIIYYRGIHISLRCLENHHMILVAGLTIIMMFQTFLIIGGVIKFIPITGVTLPFVSAGGSSLITSLMIVGVIQNIYILNSKNPSQENI